MEFNILTILSVQLRSNNYIHIVVKQISSTFSSYKTETLYPLNNNSSCLPLPGS